MKKYLLIILFLNSCGIRKVSDETYTLYPPEEKLEHIEYLNSDFYIENVVDGNVETKTLPIIIHESIIDTSYINDDGFGIISYNIPENLKVSYTYTIKLRISRNMDINSLINGRIPIISIDSKDKVIVETIMVDDYIEAKLYTDSGDFITTSIMTERQFLSENDYIEWIWRITQLDQVLNILN